MKNLRTLVCILVLGLGQSVGQSQGVDLVYDGATGNLLIETADDLAIRTFYIGAREAIFSVERPSFVTHAAPPNYEIRFGNGSFEDLSIESILQPGLETDYLLDNLCAYGFTTEHAEIRNMSVNGMGSLPVDGCVAPRNATGTVDDATVVFRYTPETGNLRYETVGTTSTGDPALVTALEMISSSEIFTGDPVPDLDRLFEVDTDQKLFLLRQEGEAGRDFGNAVATGLSHNDFVADVCVEGAWLGGGYVDAVYSIPDIGNVPFACHADTGGGPTSDVEIAYEPGSGGLTVSIVNAGADAAAAVAADLFTTLQIDSASGWFIPENGKNLGLENDEISPNRIIKQIGSGFDQLELGAVLPADLSIDEVAGDITINGTTLLGSRLDTVTVVVPEPTTVWPLLLVILWLRRRS